MQINIKTILAILILTVANTVLVSHSSEDIREIILQSFKDKPKKELFKIYHMLFNKKYDLYSEEGILRYKIFKSSLKTIEDINSQNLSYKLGLNDFADLSNEEFTQKYAKPIPVQEIDEYVHTFLKTENKKINFDELADSDEDILNELENKENSYQQTRIDWTSKMTAPTKQGDCGSCWAFATIAAIEGNYNNKFGNSPSFSQQELVDCNLENDGCDGGSPNLALNYIVSKGLAFSNSYPYKSGITSSRGVCLSTKNTRNMIVESYEHCPYKKCSNTQYYSMLQNGPLTVYIDADGGSESAKLFKLYKSGIIENMPCKSITHAVVLTGTDFDNKGQYLIARNSWGEDWGEKGNFKIRKNQRDGTCFMESFAVLPKVKRTNNPVPPAPEPGCLKLYSEPGLKGQIKEICKNSPILSFPKVNGIELGKFKEAKIFSDYDNCRGSYFTLNDSFGSFSDQNGLSPLINNIKSVIVEDIMPPSGCIWVFDLDCFSGDKLEICKDIPDLKVLNFADKISSLKLGKGIKGVTIYLKANFAGSYTTIDSDYYSMSGQWMGDTIKSLKLVK